MRDAGTAGCEAQAGAWCTPCIVLAPQSVRATVKHASRVHAAGTAGCEEQVGAIVSVWLLRHGPIIKTTTS
eukprot:1162105-Pelagomonas_calceolata.AAC.16